LNEKSKRTAARIVLNKELGIFNCFTFEASFHSYYDHERVNHEFTPAMYEAMGANLVNSLYEYMMVVEEDDRCKQAKMVEK
jgi:hydroxymethylglutaryl-CoA reductase